MPSPKRKLGDVGEKIARDYLEKQGYQILERNYQKSYPPETPWQIDVIALELNLQTKKANLKHFKSAVWQ
jgi:putative endonuclease